jgi:hypothetical protein
MRRLLLASSCLTASCTPLDLGTDLVWATDNESGDLSAWSASPGTGGPFFGAGNPSVAISSEQAHSGRYSIKISSTAATPDPTSSPGGGGMYKVGPFPQEAYYSVWYYVPQVYQTNSSWTILKFETPSSSSSDAGPTDGGQADDAGASAADAGVSTTATAGFSQLLDVRLQSLPNDNMNMTLVLVDHRRMYLMSPMPDPVPLVRTGRWFHLECFYRNAAPPDAGLGDDAGTGDDAGVPTGHLTIWLDDTMIYDVPRPMTDNPTVYFTPCSMADDLSPPSVALYIDDIAISWRRVTREGVLKLTN